MHLLASSNNVKASYELETSNKDTHEYEYS